MVTEAEGFEREWPEEGWVDAVCCEFVDLGLKPNPFKKTKEFPEGIPEHQGVLIFQLAELDTEGRRKELWFYFKMSLGKRGYRSNLFKYLQKWRGKPFTDQELRGFEMARVVEKPCQLLVAHAEDEEGAVIRAKLAGIRPAKIKDIEPSDYEDYETRQERRALEGREFQDFGAPGARTAEELLF